MAEKPNLQLGDPPSGLVRRQTSMGGIWLLGLLQILTLVAVGLLLGRRPPTDGATGVDPDRLEEIRATAIALEDRSLAAEAASAWGEYLRLAPAADSRAEVLYRIGRLRMEAEDFSAAVSVLVEADQLVEEGDPIEAKVGAKIVECLRRLGNYGEVGRELSRQVEVGASRAAQGKVLATFAGETFTEADLDRAIERTVDRLLALQPGGPLPIGRERLLQQYQSGQARQGMLQEIIQRELFSRRARELKIDRDDAFRQSREWLETELLAGRFLARELAKIQPTEVDLDSFYSAHKSDYRQPETASIVLLPLPAEQAAGAVLSGIQSADDFRKLAAEAGADTGAAPLEIAKGQPHHRLGDTSALFELAAGEWTKTPVVAGDEKLLILVESKRPATTPPLAQIRSRVEADYRRRKQQELRRKLSADLMSRYDVKIVSNPAEVTEGASSANDGSDNEPAEANE